MALDPILLVVSFIAFFLALTVHEFCHALVAYYLGDNTAEAAGRLTLNPLAHIDLIGTIILPLILIISRIGFVFGWAKPVPVNYYNLKYPKWGPTIVSLAGPAANLVFCIVSIIFFKIFAPVGSHPLDILYGIETTNNLLLPFIADLIFINLVLMAFNLIPIFPLDGSKLLLALIPDKYENFKIFWERNGIYFLIVLVLLGSGIISAYLNLFLNLLSPWL